MPINIFVAWRQFYTSFSCLLINGLHRLDAPTILLLKKRQKWENKNRRDGESNPSKWNNMRDNWQQLLHSVYFAPNF